MFLTLLIREVLGIPFEGLEEYVRKMDEECLLTRKFTQKKKNKKLRKVKKGKMTPRHKLLFEIVNKKLLSRGGRRLKANFKDLWVMNALDMCEKVVLPALMINQMRRVTSHKT